MRALLGKARTRLGVAVVGASLLAVGGTATAAVVVTSPASDSSVVEPSQPAPTTAATTAADTAPVADTPAPTVDAVTTAQPTPAPKPAPVEAAAPAVPPVAVEPADPTPYDQMAPWTDPTGRTYIPAPPVPMDPIPGEHELPNQLPGDAPAA